MDSVALLAYLADKLPRNSVAIFEQAEDGEIHLLLPTIALGEVLYTILKGKLVFGTEISFHKIDLLYEVLFGSETIKLAYLNHGGWRYFLESDVPELHDRMIVATHLQHRSCAIITNDPEIAALDSVKTIW